MFFGDTYNRRWVVGVLAAALAACGGADPTPTTAPDPPPILPEPLAVSARLVAGSNAAGFGACDWIDGMGAAARFSGFLSMTIGQDGTVYVGERANSAVENCAPSTRSRIRSITPMGWVKTHALDDVSVGPASTSFSIPAGLAAGPGSTLYVSNQAGVPPFVGGTPDWLYPAGRAAGVWRLQAGLPPSVLAGVAQPYLGSSLADGIEAQAVFTYTEHLALDGKGNLFLRDEGGRIRRIDTRNGAVTTLSGQVAAALTASPGGTVYATSQTDEIRDLESGVVLATGLPDRVRVAVDQAGTVYAATSTLIHRKRKSEARFSPLAGTLPAGEALVTPLQDVRAIAVAPTGGMYVFDRHALLHLAD